MRARVQCECGWQRELSEFYAGKRIRCPECAVVLDVPGVSAGGLYNSPLPERAKPRQRPASHGCWVGVADTCAPRRCCGGTWITILVIMFVCGMNVWRQARSEQHAVPTEGIERYERPEYVPKAPVEPESKDNGQAKPKPEPDPAAGEDEF
jgi:hypothetical protein